MECQPGHGNFIIAIDMQKRNEYIMHEKNFENGLSIIVIEM